MIKLLEYKKKIDNIMSKINKLILFISKLLYLFILWYKNKIYIILSWNLDKKWYNKILSLLIYL